MCRRRKNFRFSLKPSKAFPIAGEGLRQRLDGDITLKAGVASPVDLSHPAGTNSGNDFVWADTSAGEETHVREVRIIPG